MGDEAVKRPEAEEFRTVSSAANKRSQGASFDSESLARPQATNSGNARLHLSPDEVMNIEEISFDTQAEITLFRAKN